MVQIKGTVLVDAIEAVKSRAGDDELKQIVKSLNGEARKLFEGQIFPSNWYSLDHFAAFLAATVDKTAGGNREILIARSEKVTERQLRGIYRIFVKLGSPEFVVKRIAAVHSTYFQGVDIFPEFDGVNKATLKYLGFEKQHQIMEYGIRGFYRKALEISGAKNVNAQFTTSIAEGLNHSVLAVTWE